MRNFATICRRAVIVTALAIAALGVAPVAAQVQAVDPNAAIDGDLNSSSSNEALPAQPAPAWEPLPPAGQSSELPPDQSVVTSPDAETAAGQATSDPATAAAQGDTYKEDDLIGAAEGVFGKGAEGLAGIIEDILSKQGEPNGYIVGREGGGALFVGARYGSGTLYHKIEGQRPVYWTGPSLGLDIGANAANAFVLVYNLHDTQDLYHRYPQGEGQAYFIGGFHVSYMRRGNVVLIPVRMGAGLRLGVNVGYMNFSEKQRWLPF